jgi:NitT/TauT family transport system ATP-binding protein
MSNDNRNDKSDDKSQDTEQGATTDGKTPSPAAPVDPKEAADALAALEQELAGEATPTPPTPPAKPVTTTKSDSGVKTSKITASANDQPAAAKAPVVSFRNVTKRYGDGPNAFTAIKDVSFEIADIPGRGEFVSILGPSGCGKSTVIRMIAGLEPQFPQSEGEVFIDGKLITGPGADRGMVFQDYTSFDHMSVLDNVAFGLRCRGVSKSESNDKAKHWIAKVGLSIKNDCDKYPHQLSGGMRQRVAIARTLILEPRIILMDEPFGALDPPTRARMQDNLVALWREQSPTIFFITHSIEEAVFLGDHILIFSNSPGTVLKTVRVPPPDRPSLQMHRDPKFQETVFGIRDVIEKLESSQRAGD